MSKPLEQLLELRREAERRLYAEKLSSKYRITVGSATCENAAGANEVYSAFDGLIRERGLKDVTLSRVGCTGRCAMEPVVTVFRKGEMPVKYSLMNPEKAAAVMES